MGTKPIVTDVEAYRRATREKLRARLAQERLKMEREGRYAFRGAWRPLPEIEAVQAKSVKTDRSLFFELIGVYVLMVLVDVGLFVFLDWIT